MPEVTYKRLDEILRSLGFSVGEPEPGTRVYRHESTGAMVILPIRNDPDLVAPHHTLGTQNDSGGIWNHGPARVYLATSKSRLIARP
jgi:hypothetical protein